MSLPVVESIRLPRESQSHTMKAQNARLVSPIDSTHHHHQLYILPSSNASIWGSTYISKGCDDLEGLLSPHAVADGSSSPHQKALLMAAHHHGPCLITQQPEHAPHHKKTSPADSPDSKTDGQTDGATNVRHSSTSTTGTETNECLRGRRIAGAQGIFSGQDSNRTLFWVPDTPTTRGAVIANNNNAAGPHNHNNLVLDIDNNNTTSTMVASTTHLPRPLMPQSINQVQHSEAEWCSHASKRARSRAIAIKKRTPTNSNKITSDAVDEAAGSSSGNEHMYDFATWRMYHRIIDHRQKYPVAEAYRPSTCSSEASTEEQRESSARLGTEDDQADLQQQPHLHPKPTRRVDFSDLDDDAIFDMDI